MDRCRGASLIIDENLYKGAHTNPALAGRLIHNIRPRRAEALRAIVRRARASRIATTDVVHLQGA